MDILFLDANVLFSAAYRKDAGLLIFWKLPKVHLVTSLYAIEEARRNLRESEQLERLEKLLVKMKLIPLTDSISLPKIIELRDKDKPILTAAISAKANYLITGDSRDFGRYFGKEITGVTIMTPAEYLKLKKHK